MEHTPHITSLYPLQDFADLFRTVFHMIPIHAKPWSMDEGLLQESKTLALHSSSTAFPVDISAIRNCGKRTRPQ